MNQVANQVVHQVDAFTAKPFAGNPAAVCVQSGPVSDRWMQLAAREMNLSETAFLHPEGDGFRLRWFTPTAEVELCGHGTLAAAHVLFETGTVTRGETIRFETLSGALIAERKSGRIELDFPATPDEPTAPPPGLLEALGVAATYVGRSKFDLLVEVESEDVVRRLEPDIAALCRVDARGVIVTSRAGSPEYDFVSRFFAPAVGVDEDPVTGSAHCCLGPYWMRQLGRDAMVARQVSERGGTVHVRVDGDRVHLGGHAVTVMRGEIVGP